MPVNRLLVEGKLDAEIISALVSASGGAGPAVTAEGAKGGLPPYARKLRKDQPDTCYLRDRDFDFDPPEDLGRPTVDSVFEGLPLGWRWCRGTIECYYPGRPRCDGDGSNRQGAKDAKIGRSLGVLGALAVQFRPSPVLPVGLPG